MNKKIKFDELKLSQEVLKAVADKGFVEASPIQAQAIPFIAAGRDVTGLAMTGTGKTAAFGLPLIDKIDSQNKNTQALILCPTRELAIQVSTELSKYLKYKRGISVLPVYGGQQISRQLYPLSRGVQIVVGTPGRLIDHMNRGSLNLNNIKIVVLDEADEMLNMGFRADIETILKNLPQNRQTITFSATMSRDILNLIQKYQVQPEIIKVASDNSTATTVEQYYFEIDSIHKFALLTKLLNDYSPYLAIVFCNTKRKVDLITTKLRRCGFAVEGLHGDISQPKRNKVMDRFRAGYFQLLVATDVAARGIDVPNIDMVFNFELPKEEKAYVHRIGRTGRAGKTGKAISFVGREDRYTFRGIQHYTRANFIYQATPSLVLQDALTGVNNSNVVTKKVDDQFNQMVNPNIEVDSLVAKVKRILEEKDLSKHTQTVEALVAVSDAPAMVSAALIELLNQNNSNRVSRERRIRR